MKKLEIFEQDCCSNVEFCGDELRKELERVAAVILSLERHQIVVERHRPATSWSAFQNYPQVNCMINRKGVDCYPLVTLDGRGVMCGRYPSNEEFATLLDVPIRWIYDRNV